MPVLTSCQILLWLQEDFSKPREPCSDTGRHSLKKCSSSCPTAVISSVPVSIVTLLSFPADMLRYICVESHRGIKQHTAVFRRQEKGLEMNQSCRKTHGRVNQ